MNNNNVFFKSNVWEWDNELVVKQSKLKNYKILYI